MLTFNDGLTMPSAMQQKIIIKTILMKEYGSNTTGYFSGIKKIKFANL
jgi:hypothetical protein